MNRFILLMLYVLMGGLTLQSVWGQTVYRCETEEGIKFSPQPCANDAEKLRPHDGSGGASVLDGDQEVATSEASAHDGPVPKNLAGQVRDNKFWLHDNFLTKKSPQRNCGQWVDKNGMLVYIKCNE